MVVSHRAGQQGGAGRILTPMLQRGGVAQGGQVIQHAQQPGAVGPIGVLELGVQVVQHTKLSNRSIAHDFGSRGDQDHDNTKIQSKSRKIPDRCTFCLDRSHRNDIQS